MPSWLFVVGATQYVVSTQPLPRPAPPKVKSRPCWLLPGPPSESCRARQQPQHSAFWHVGAQAGRLRSRLRLAAHLCITAGSFLRDFSRM